MHLRRGTRPHQDHGPHIRQSMPPHPAMRALLLVALLTAGAATPLPTIDDVLLVLDGDEDARATLKNEVYSRHVTGLYAQVNPEKLGSVPAMMQKYRGREEFLLAALNDKYPWGKQGKDVTFLIFPAADAATADGALPAAVYKREKDDALILFFYSKSHVQIRESFSKIATAARDRLAAFAMDCNHERNAHFCAHSAALPGGGLQLLLFKGKETTNVSRLSEVTFTTDVIQAFVDEKAGIKLDLA